MFLLTKKKKKHSWEGNKDNHAGSTLTFCFPAGEAGKKEKRKKWLKDKRKTKWAKTVMQVNCYWSRQAHDNHHASIIRH